MALYRFAAGVIARSAGHSSTAAAAYRAGERLTDERTGQTHDYSRRTGVLWTGIYAPKNAPEWVQDRSQLWNAAEKAEKRKDAQTAREFIVCIPHELNPEQGRRLVGDFLRENFARKGFVADAAIHAPGKGGDERNTHAHFLVTMRQVDGRGFAATKDRTQNEKATLLGWRENWARLGNRHLERAGHAGTLDHRSYEDQGIQRAAGQHIGKAAKNMERRGIPTEAAERRKAFEGRVAEIADLRAELAKLEATPEGPNTPPQPANDPGRPEGRPANENAPGLPPGAAPPILKAEAPAGPDPARPIGLATVAERPPLPNPLPPAAGVQPTIAPAPPAAAAEAPPRAGERPVREEVSPQTSDAVESKPGPATAEPPATVARPQRQRMPDADRPASRRGIRAMFAAAVDWTRGVFGIAKGGLDHKSAEAPRPPRAAVVSQRPPERPQASTPAVPILRARPTPARAQMRPSMVIQGMAVPPEKAAEKQQPATPEPEPAGIPDRLSPDQLRAALEEQERAFGQDVGGFDL